MGFRLLIILRLLTLSEWEIWRKGLIREGSGIFRPSLTAANHFSTYRRVTFNSFQRHMPHTLSFTKSQLTDLFRLDGQGGSCIFAVDLNAHITYWVKSCFSKEWLESWSKTKRIPRMVTSGKSWDDMALADSRTTTFSSGSLRDKV